MATQPAEPAQAIVTHLEYHREAKWYELRFTAYEPETVRVVAKQIAERVPTWALEVRPYQAIVMIDTRFFQRIKDLFTNGAEALQTVRGPGDHAKRKTGADTSAAAHFARLHLLSTASPELVRAAYAVEQEAHEGQPAVLDALAEAYHAALAFAQDKHAYPGAGIVDASPMPHTPLAIEAPSAPSGERKRRR